MRRETINQEYFSWLYSIIGKQPRTSYVRLCSELHKKPFRWSIHNDDNRCEDGLNLRDQFVQERDLDEDHLEVRYFLKGDCTVFEMLVAFAQRINDYMYDLNDQGDKTPLWFLEMISNLRLNSYDDLYIDRLTYPAVVETKIDEVLEIFMDRTYAYDGTGGLFPLKGQPPKDMTKIELWYQLMLYLEEKTR